MEQTISLHPLRQTQYSIPAHETIMPSKVPLTAIVAMGARGEIGQDGTMPWHLPEDLRHFKEIGNLFSTSYSRPLPNISFCKKSGLSACLFSRYSFI